MADKSPLPQGAGGGENAAEIVAEALRGGTDAGGEEFGQIKRQPSVKCRGRATREENHHEKR